MKKGWLGLMLGGFCVFSLNAMAEDVELKMSNGLTALGSLDMADGKTLKDDGVVLFIHGTLAHKDMAIVAAQRELLNEREINVLAVNLTLGQDKRSGMYDCTMPHTHKHRDALAEIGSWLNWLKGQDVSSVTLMGHSRGGNQAAWYAAANQNDLVKKVVLVAPQTWSADYVDKDYVRRYKIGLLQVLNAMMAKTEKGKGAEFNEEIDFIYCPKAKVTADAFVDYYKADQKLNTPSLLAEIKKPTLVVAASEDTVVADLPAQMEQIDQGNVTFVTVEDADHMFIDFAGEDLADQVAEFIATQ